MPKFTKDERAQARERLLELLKPGDTVYTKIVSVARSGMSRKMDLYVMRDNSPQRITWWVAALCDYSYDRKAEALRADGCGMDMGFAVVYDLSYHLFPKNPKREDGDGGYSLSQRWL